MPRAAQGARRSRSPKPPIDRSAPDAEFVTSGPNQDDLRSALLTLVAVTVRENSSGMTFDVKDVRHESGHAFGSFRVTVEKIELTN